MDWTLGLREEGCREERAVLAERVDATDAVLDEGAAPFNGAGFFALAEAADDLEIIDLDFALSAFARIVSRYLITAFRNAITSDGCLVGYMGSIYQTIRSSHGKTFFVLTDRLDLVIFYDRH